MRFPGFTRLLKGLETAVLPTCPRCGSRNTARVQVGHLDRELNLAGATSKFKLVANKPRKGNWYCNRCLLYYGSCDGAASGPH